MNRARKVLMRVEDAAWRRSLEHHDPYAPVTAWDLGRLSDAATVADDAIFHVLSTARNHCQVNITEAQLLGTEPPQTDAAPTPEATEATDVPTPSPARPLLPSSEMPTSLRSVSRGSSSQ